LKRKNSIFWGAVRKESMDIPPQISPEDTSLPVIKTDLGGKGCFGYIRMRFLNVGDIFIPLLFTKTFAP